MTPTRTLQLHSTVHEDSTVTLALVEADLPETGPDDVVVRGLGGCAASHVEGTGPASAFRATLTGRPWVVVTVPTLVLCARWLGWSRESATTSLVTGLVLIPFGRLHIFPSLPPPRLSYICVL